MRTFLRSKIHHLTITQADLNYEGSLTLDPNLMEAAYMEPYEQVHILNMNNGERFTTYLIEGEPGSGVACLNGPCARLGQVGDKIIVITYETLAGVPEYPPAIILVDKNNQQK